MANIILIIVTSAALLLFFNWLMGYQKGNIIDFEERHFNRNEYVAAIHSTLESEGRESQLRG